MYLQKKCRKCKPEAKESGYVRGEGGAGNEREGGEEGEMETWS